MAGEDGVEVARNVEGLNAFKADGVSDEARAMVAGGGGGGGGQD
jgi:hypothetical protein